jgi:hypothetical protein
VTLPLSVSVNSLFSTRTMPLARPLFMAGTEEAGVSPTRYEWRKGCWLLYAISGFSRAAQRNASRRPRLLGYSAPRIAPRLAGSNRHTITRRDLGAVPFGVHLALIALYHAVVEAVLDVRALVLCPRTGGLSLRRPGGDEPPPFPECDNHVLQLSRKIASGMSCTAEAEYRL